MNKPDNAIQAHPLYRDDLRVEIYPTEAEIAKTVALDVRDYLQDCITKKGHANVIFATGSSQLLVLKELTGLSDLNWSKIVGFHLDEYLGLPAPHPASFSYYLQKRVVDQVNAIQFYFIRGDADEPLAECDRYTSLLKQHPPDLCFLGIGENGHLAFNEPHLENFYDRHLIKLVKLDEKNRQQQVKQGNFPSLEKVPQYGYTLTIPLICSAKKIVCFAFGERKAKIVQTMLTQDISNTCPASILRHQKQATLYLDQEAAQLIIG